MPAKPSCAVRKRADTFNGCDGSSVGRHRPSAAECLFRSIPTAVQAQCPQLPRPFVAEHRRSPLIMRIRLARLGFRPPVVGEECRGRPIPSLNGKRRPRLPRRFRKGDRYRQLERGSVPKNSVAESIPRAPAPADENPVSIPIGIAINDNQPLLSRAKSGLRNLGANEMAEEIASMMPMETSTSGVYEAARMRCRNHVPSRRPGRAPSKSAQT